MPTVRHLRITKMSMSWASIAKRNIKPAPTIGPASGTGPAPTTGPAPESTDDDFYKEWFHHETARTKEELTLLEKEEQDQCRPTWHSLQRPNAPTTFPVFKTREEMHAWERAEFRENQKYSDEVFERRMQAWRIKNNWLLPPMKTKVSSDEMRRGFYVSDDPRIMNVVYITPFSTEPDLAFDASLPQKSMIEMMWCLIHSRSDELVACKTVAEFKALFERNIHLEPDLRHVHRYSRRKDTYPLKMLWLLSQKANVFPGKARPGTARWTIDPVRMNSVFDPKIYSKSMIFFSSQKFRDSNNSIIHGQRGGREETGICVVERLKENGDAAPIRWLLSAKQLHEMERVVFYPEPVPFRTIYDGYSSDDYF